MELSSFFRLGRKQLDSLLAEYKELVLALDPNTPRGEYTEVANEYAEALTYLLRGDREFANRSLDRAISNERVRNGVWARYAGGDDKVQSPHAEVEIRLQGHGLPALAIKKTPQAKFESDFHRIFYEWDDSPICVCVVSSYTTKDGQPERLISARFGRNAGFEQLPALRQSVLDGVLDEVGYHEELDKLRCHLLEDAVRMEHLLAEHRPFRRYLSKPGRSVPEEYSSKFTHTCNELVLNLHEKMPDALCGAVARKLIAFRDAVENSGVVRDFLDVPVSERVRMTDFKTPNVLMDEGGHSYFDFDKAMRQVHPAHDRAHIWFDPAYTDLTVEERVQGLRSTLLHDRLPIGDSAEIGGFFYLFRQAYINLGRPLVVPYTSWVSERRFRTMKRLEMLSELAVRESVQEMLPGAEVAAELLPLVPHLNCRIYDAQQGEYHPLTSA